MTHVDDNLVKIDPRYTAQLEYGGWTGKLPVLRWCGDVVGNFMSFDDCIKAAHEHLQNREWKLVLKEGSVLLLMKGKRFRVAYGADVNDYSDEMEAFAQFGYCVLHEKKGNGEL